MAAETMKIGPGQHHLTTRLQAIAALSDVERRALAELPMTTRQVKAGEDIVREGERTHASCVVIEGFLLRYTSLSEGRRQILAFHIPGDVPDLQSLHLPLMDHTLAAVTDSVIANIPHAALAAALHAHRALEHALWREALIDAAKFREWIANIGGRAALPRLAHLFCELFIRNRIVGLTDGDSFNMPLTQTELGEAMGLSTVHVNRLMSELKRRGLVRKDRGRLHIPDFDALARLADFDPTYLHLREETDED
jgi:CRP-like cAMP-binding protein